MSSIIKKLNKNYIVIFAIIFGIVATIVLLKVLASTNGVGIESESVKPSGPASIISDSSASGGKAIIFAEPSSPSPSPKPPPSSACSTRINKSVLSGTVSSYTGSPASGSTVDATKYTVSNSSTWLVTPGGGKDVCWIGGEYKNTIADSATGSPTNAWATYWHHNGGFTLKNNNTGWIFDGVSVHHTGDAFNISTSGDNFEIRNSHIYDIRDDCVQNDYYLNGYVHDNLFESCYSGFSSKASQGTTPNGKGKTWTISNNIAYIAPTWSVYKNSSPGNGPFIKWAQPGDGLGTPEHLVFKNNVIRIDQCPFTTSCKTFWFPSDIEFSNNSLYWGGSGSPPSELTNMFNAAHNSKMISKAQWDAAVSGWKAAHPGVK